MIFLVKSEKVKKLNSCASNHGRAVYIIDAEHRISSTACRCISSLRERIQPAADDIHLR